MAAKLPLEKSVATRIIKRREWTAIKYHDTEVCRFDQDKIILTSGGWPTVTTLRRINQASARYLLGFHVYQEKFDWFVKFPNEDPIPFYDEMIISRDRTQPDRWERSFPGDRDYNGWPNRATWNCMLWLNNEERYYRAYVAQARREPFTASAARYFVPRLFGFQSCWNARTPDGEPLHRVHWDRIAEAMNEGAKP